MTDAFLVNRRVLIVEEDLAVRDLVTDLFDFWGARASTVGASDAALETAGLAEYDLVVLSWDFQAACPGRILSRIELMRPGGPGLVVTSARGLGSGPVPLRLGGSKLAVIVKPFSMEALRLTSRSALISSWVARAVAADVHRLALPMPSLHLEVGVSTFCGAA